MSKNIYNDLKDLLIRSLDIEDLTIEDIDTDALLFGDDLGLDSIDALELGIAIKKQYNVSLSAEDEKNREYFKSIRTLADFITQETE